MSDAMNILKLTKDDHSHVWSHLLPKNTKIEQAAFLFCKTVPTNGGVLFEATDHILLGPSDFVAQYSDHIELTDDTRIRLIKHAHHTGTAIAELHSHLGPWSAAFSLSDLIGLKETVPHMRWRLKQRPYLAIVVTLSGFDALVWSQDPKIPELLSGIDIDGRFIVPTNNSLEWWADE